MTNAQERGWGAGWPTHREADQVKITRGGSTPTAAWVHRAIAPLVLEGIRRTEEVVGYDVRMLGGYAYRPITGSTSVPSNHSWGLAVDINWDNNPFMIHGPLVTDMPATMVELWKSLGFGWGGDYSKRKDAMHFEYLHTPGDAAALIASLGLAPGHLGAAPGDQVARPLLRLGARGESVVLLQTRLNAHGATLKADGSFGQLTLAAVVAFQRAGGLSPDGIVGPMTWAGLG